MLTQIRQRRAKKRLFRLLVLVLFIVILYTLISHFIKIANQTSNKKIVSPLTAKDYKIQTNSPTPLQISAGLQNAVSTALQGSHGIYGVYIKNLKTGESYYEHQTHIFKSGSLYKLWVMATVFKQIKEKKLTENTVLSKSVKDLNSAFQINPTLAEKTEGTITFSVKDALYQMITISDNYAALLLAQKVGLSSIAQFLQQYGFYNSKVGVNGKDPVTDATDTTLFLEKLYKGQLIDKNYSNEMLDLLKQQRLNSKLPKYLPDGVTIAHKTGELDNDTHDAGIVYSDSGDYIIVILSESDSRDLAEERIAQISQNVYSYFTGEKVTPQPTITN